MNRAQANTLSDIIKQQSLLKPDIRPIGNGECVVVINDFHLWSIADWEKHKHNWSSYLYRLEAMK